MMNFLNLNAFWGLIALLIPTIIMLWSKQKQNIVEFGSLQFLDESESKSAKSIFPTQWLLYFLRVAILCLLVLLMSKPLFEDKPIGKRVFIEKNVYEDPSFAAVLNGLNEEVEIKIVEPKSTSVLLQQLSSIPDSIVVYSRSYLKNFNGSKNEIAPNVEWNVVPHETEYANPSKIAIDEENYQLNISANEDGISWSKSVSEDNTSLDIDSIGINLYSSSERSAELVKLKSLLQSYQSNLPLTFDFESSSAPWSIALDTIVDTGESKMIVWNSYDGPMEVDQYSDSLYNIHGQINRDNLVESDFPLQLAHILMSDLLNTKALDRRIYLPQESSQSIVRKAAISKSERKNYWWPFILILVLVERFYSFKLRSK